MIKATLDAARGSLDTSNRFSLFSSSIVFSRSSSDHFHIPVTLRGVHRTKDIVAMVDSGATATFIHRKFVEENKIRTRKLSRPVPLFNIDGTENREGSITHVAVLDLIIGSHSEKMVLRFLKNEGKSFLYGKT